MENTMGRVFVGGLSRDATKFTLMEYFSSFGAVDDCFIITDKTTRWSKGYGSVSFIDSSVAEQVLAHPEHTILGVKVDVKPATPRGQGDQSQVDVKPATRMGQRGQSQEHDNNDNGASNIHLNRFKRIFVGGLPNDLTIEQFRTYFERYGPVKNANLMNGINGKPRGFGFITFQSEVTASCVLQIKFHVLNNKCVEAKRAEPKERMVCGQLEKCDCNNTGFAYQQGSFSPCGQVWTYDPYRTALPYYQGSFYPGQVIFPSVSYYQNPCYGCGYGYATPLNGYWDASASSSVNSVIQSGTHPLGTSNLVGERTSHRTELPYNQGSFYPGQSSFHNVLQYQNLSLPFSSFLM